jgi:hypothetical protein
MWGVSAVVRRLLNLETVETFQVGSAGVVTTGISVRADVRLRVDDTSTTISLQRLGLL